MESSTRWTRLVGEHQQDAKTATCNAAKAEVNPMTPTNHAPLCARTARLARSGPRGTILALEGSSTLPAVDRVEREREGRLYARPSCGRRHGPAVWRRRGRNTRGNGWKSQVSGEVRYLASWCESSPPHSRPQLVAAGKPRRFVYLSGAGFQHNAPAASRTTRRAGAD